MMIHALAGGRFIISLLYLNCYRIPDGQADREVQSSLDKSIINYNLADITGALLFTGVHFCQFLEGQEDAVLGLMQTIRGNLRHSDIWVVHKAQVKQRRFTNWSMAYGGRSNFVSSHLMVIINASDQTEHDSSAKSVIAIIEELTRQFKSNITREHTQ